MSNCSTASATARRKSPSPAFSSNSASTNLSSVIGSSRVLQVEVLQLHLSRPGPMATSTTPQPYTADRPENSTTTVDANPRHRDHPVEYPLSEPRHHRLAGGRRSSRPPSRSPVAPWLGARQSNRRLCLVASRPEDGKR